VKTPATAITATDGVRKSAGKLVSFSPADDASATPSAVAPPDRAWIKSNEPASRLIIAATPADDAPSVWWSVDRNTGNVLGRASGGGGQAMTERTIKEVSVIVKWILCMGWDVVYAGSKRMTNWSLLRAGICLVGTGLGVAALDIKTPGFLIGMLIWEAVSKSLLKVVPT